MTFLTRASSSWRWGWLHTAAEEGQAQPAALCQAGGGRRGAARRVPGGTGGRGLGARTETEPRSEPSARTERAAEPALGPAAPHRSVEARKSPPVCL